MPRRKVRPASPWRSASGHRIERTGYSLERCLSGRPNRCPCPAGSSLPDLLATDLPLPTSPLQILVEFIGVLGPASEGTSQTGGHEGILADRRNVLRRQFRMLRDQ